MQTVQRQRSSLARASGGSPAGSAAFRGGDTGSLGTSEEIVKRDCADLLYRHLLGGQIMTTLTALLLYVMIETPGNSATLKLWLGATLLSCAIRTIDVVYWHPKRRANGTSAQRDIAYFSAGTLAACLLWAMFPLLFFATITRSQLMGAFVVMSALAGGSSTVLRPSLFLSTAYCAAQLLVPAAVYLTLPGRENTVLGLLAIAMFCYMAVFARQQNRSVIAGLRLRRANEALVAQSERLRAETDMINQDLVNAQTALSQANHALEQRVERRTEALAREGVRRQAYADALSQLASTDPLTGLCNRITFAQRLSTMLLDASDTGTHLALLFLDIDNFKQVNDVRGHSAGDVLLRTASKVMIDTVGNQVEIARWGGDEFLIAVPATTRDQAVALAEHLHGALLRPLAGGTEAICVDVTIGVALYPRDGLTPDELIRAADVAMYEAKKQGKGRIRQFDPGLALDLANRHVLEQALRGAAERNEFSLAFQPIFAATSGQCVAVETLLRWRHPELGVIDPATAVQVAEQTGQIAGIGRWVLQQACRTAVSWPARAPAVTVNVSVAQVQSGTLIEDVTTALRLSGLPPERLQLEITESMFVSDPVRIAPVFEELRSRGHRILLDDFGTGYSSLTYLSKLPLDVIKVDRSFVRVAEQEGYAIIHAILSIARALSLKVTAEGVETEAQRDTLTAMGVDNLQGYLLSRPMTGDALMAWLAARPIAAAAPAQAG